MKYFRIKLNSIVCSFCQFQLLFSAFYLGIVSYSNSQSEESLLRVGDAAPPIKVQAWIKGTPISSLKKGHFYVMEFGSVGCGPCRVSIPHMTKVAREYTNELSLVSFFIYENGSTPTDTINTSYVKRVEGFINKLGDAVSYAVAVDDPKQTMANTWMKASGQKGIPVAFIIDKSGTIAWIGHPLDLELVVGDIIQDKSPIATSKKIDITNVMLNINTLRQEKRFDDSLSKLDSLIEQNPHKPHLNRVKFQILLEADESKAYSFCKEILMNQCRDVDYILSDIASDIFYSNAIKNNETAMDVVIALTGRAIELSKDEVIYASLSCLQAQAYFRKGDVRRAIEIAEKGLSHLSKLDYQDIGGTKRDVEYHLNVFKSSL